MRTVTSEPTRRLSASSKLSTSNSSRRDSPRRGLKQPANGIWSSSRSMLICSSARSSWSTRGSRAARTRAASNPSKWSPVMSHETGPCGATTAPGEAIAGSSPPGPTPIPGGRDGSVGACGCTTSCGEYGMRRSRVSGSSERSRSVNGAHMASDRLEGQSTPASLLFMMRCTWLKLFCMTRLTMPITRGSIEPSDRIASPSGIDLPDTVTQMPTAIL
mmetsp:Transcript_793/g.2323  ORF Transcript_793/g.2323 Transcript_793/m.2323 type:complete len:217 (+) Transcript_793:1273-1923(+)